MNPRWFLLITTNDQLFSVNIAIFQLQVTLDCLGCQCNSYITVSCLQSSYPIMDILSSVHSLLRTMVIFGCYD